MIVWRAEHCFIIKKYSSDVVHNLRMCIHSKETQLFSKYLALVTL